MIVLWVLLSVLIGFTIACLVSVTRQRRMDEDLRRQKMLTQAARWLLAYNYGWLASVTEAFMMYSGQSYAAIQQLSLGRVDCYARRGNLGQMAPLSQVPIALREAVLLHNHDVSARWGSQYPTLVGKEGKQEARIRQLQDALTVARYGLTEETTEEDVSALARSSGVSYVVMERALEAIRHRLSDRIDKILAVEDPESVLPSIY